MHLIFTILFSTSIFLAAMVNVPTAYACSLFNADCLISKLKRGKLQLGLGVAERSLVFEKTESKQYRDYDDYDGQTIFELKNHYDVIPVISFSFPDSYFENSSIGYGFGYRYVRSKVNKQVIQREGREEEVDLGTSASMNIFALNGSVFYPYQFNRLPGISFRPGVGLNIMYSRIKGRAYETELPSNSDCYAAGINYMNNNVGKHSLRQNCSLSRFDDRYLGAGIKLFTQARWQQWESEFSVATYQQFSDSKYRSKTEEVMLTISRFITF